LFKIEDIEGLNEESIGIERKHLSLFFEPVKQELKDYIILGDMIEDGDLNVGLLPKYFYPDYTNELGFLKNQIEFINSEKLIGKTITIFYNSNIYSKGNYRVNNTYQYSFKVIGVYDNIATADDTYDVYVPYDDMKKIISTIEGDSYNDDGSLFIFNESKQIYAVVKNQDDVDIVISDMMKKNIFLERKAMVGDIERMSFMISYIGKVIGLISFVIAGIIIYVNSINIIKLRIGEIGLLKVVGYKDKEIHKFFLVESIMISFLSIIFIAVATFFMIQLVRLFITKQMSIYFSSIKIVFDFKWYLFVVAMSIIIPLLSMKKALKSLDNIEIINALKN
jgi:ABC-type antimicrobial peptide transport system permease subunit